jgi:hypothetical protein
MNTVLLVLPWVSSFALSLWIPDMVDRFEAVVLVPLATTSILLAMIYLFQRAWWLGAWFVLLWLLVGRFGASLHPDMNISRLAKGTISYPNSPDGGRLKEVNPHQANRLAIVLFKTSFVSGVTVVLLSHHERLGLSAAVLLGLAGAVLGPTATFLYAIVTAAPFLLVSGRTRPPKAQV